MGEGFPRRVQGTVTRHESFGFYVDFGGEQEGLVVITMISDNPNEEAPAFPPLGSTVVAALLGLTVIGGQPRLSVRPMDLEVAAALEGARTYE